MPANGLNRKARPQSGPSPARPWPAPPADRTVWSPHLIDRLVALWNGGESAARIAARLGLSRNAVIGKVYRLQLCRRNAAVTAERLAAQAETRRRRAIRGLSQRIQALRAADPAGSGMAGGGTVGDGTVGGMR